MNSVTRSACAGSFVAGLFLIALYAWAIEEKPIPTFMVTRSDGLPVASTHLSELTQYLLMYVAPNCRSCDHLLASLQDSESPQLARHIVVIVSGDTTNAAKYIHDHVPPEVEGVVWYADTTGEAFTALRLTGTPVLIGVRHRRLIWSVSGVLNDASTVQSVIRNWVKH